MVVLTTLFFMWGFMTVMNDVLIPHLKAVFTLSYAQSMLVQFAFFGAYFVGSVAYFALSLRGSDPIRRLGYKRASIAGLLLSALGAVLFVPATYVHVYGAYLAALFVLGLGFTLLQIAANPFVAIIGEPEGASGRLNLAQAFNSLGTTLAPIVGGALIFRLFAGDAAVRWPYLAFAGLLVLQAGWLWLTRLPEPPPSKAATGRAWEHPQLVRGMVAIFCYVGAEVAIGSLLISFAGLPRVMGLTADDAKVYLSLYWGGAMIGRFLGAISLGRQMPARWRTVVMVGLGLVLFWLLFVLNRLESGVALDQVNTLLLFIGLNIFVFHLAGPNAGRALGLFALVTMGLLVAAVSGGGPWALWALTAIGLFNSIMWSNTFTLAIDGLGEDTAQGSSLLVMMIVGGALLPYLQGLLADSWATPEDPDAGLQQSFLLPLVCYAYLAWYGLRGSRHNKSEAA